MVQSSKKTRYALFGAGACFLLVDALLAASIGVAEWFTSTQAIRFQKGPLGSTGYMGTQTTLTEIRTGVNGRVIQEYKILLEVTKDNGGNFGSFSCDLFVDWNYWAQTKEGDCKTNMDNVLPVEMKEYGRRVCNEMVCPFLNQVVLSSNAPNPTCGLLERQRDQTGVSQPIAQWEEKAICSGAKGILSVLVLALVSATTGFAMCFCCWRSPRWMIVPGLLCCLLSAVAVIAYGAAISSDYPYEAAILNDLRVSDSNQVANASSGVSTVQIGFGLAIAAAVLSLVSCWLASIAGYIGSADGTELQVVSAVPIHIYQTGQDNEAPPQQGEHVMATVLSEPVIATSEVIVDAPMSGGSGITPHAEARIVHTDSQRPNGGHAVANGSGIARSIALPQAHEGDEGAPQALDAGHYSAQYPMQAAPVLHVEGETPHDNFEPTPRDI